MRKGPTGRVVLLIVAILSATTAAHAATTLASTDVRIVGNSASLPAMLTRNGPPVPITLAVTANDGSIASDACDGVRNVATSGRDYVVGAGPSVSASGPSVSAAFACDRNFASMPQVGSLALTVTAGADAPLGNSAVPVSVGPTGGSGLVALGDQLAPVTGFVPPSLQVRINPRPPSGVRTSVGNGQIRIDWDASPDADVTHYVVARGSGLFQTLFVVPASETTFTDTGLTNGSTYCYRVRARYVDGLARRFQSVETAPMCASPVPFTLEGFFEPLTPGTTFTASAGRAAPLKWRLLEGTNQIVDTEIGPGHWSLSSMAVACDTGLAGETGVADSAGSSGLQYDTEAGHYVFVWKTEKAWAGTCRRFSATYAGQSLGATFAFKG
ncbi:MAG: PxKF domain-containing protein [Gaiellales bacterium]